MKYRKTKTEFTKESRKRPVTISLMREKGSPTPIIQTFSSKLYESCIAVLVVSILFAGVVSGCTAKKQQARLPLCSEGTETQRSVVNMKELGEQEARKPPATEPPEVVHKPLPGPTDRSDTDSRQQIDCLPR
jgi:hypothetical protein